MNTIAHSLPHHVGPSPFGPGGSFTNFESLSRLQAERHANAEITIETTEGDRVSLSANIGQRASFERYNARGQFEGGESRQHSQSREFNFSDAIQIRVEGDLNESELADIRKIIGAQGELLSDFLKKGEIEDDFAKELDFGKLGTIAGVDASFDVAQRIDVARQFSGIRFEGDGKDHEDDHDHDDKKINRHGVDKLIGKLFNTLNEHSDNPEKIAGKLPKLIGKLFNKIGGEHGFGSPKQKLAEQITNRFLNVLDAFVANPGGNLPGDDTPNGPTIGAPPLDAPTRTPDSLTSQSDTISKPAPNSTPAELQTPGNAETPSAPSKGVTQLNVEQQFSSEFHAHLDFSFRRNGGATLGETPVNPAVDAPVTQPKPAPQDLPGVEFVNPTTPFVPNIAATPTTGLPPLGTIADTLKPSLSTLLDRLQGAPSGLNTPTAGSTTQPSVLFGTPRPGLPTVPNEPAPTTPGIPTESILNLLNRLQSPNNTPGLTQPSVSFIA